MACMCTKGKIWETFIPSYSVESLAVDWISNKLYWTDVGERVIGVLDLVSYNYKHSLISTETSVSPRGVVVDPVMR
jgi:DNA-binding beta-propeller fold protein YncE